MFATHPARSLARSRRIAAIVGAALMLVLAAARVDTAAAYTLPFNAPSPSCQDWQDGVGESVIVTPPDISPLSNALSGPGLGIVVNPEQWVGYQISIYHWKSTGGWELESRSPRWVKPVSGSSPSNNGLPWKNAGTNKWEYPQTRYRLSRSGYYGVWIDYYWYSNQYYPSASTSGWAYAAGWTSSHGWCVV
jgi:hypothetical protein